jgi:hypothetical protein
MKNATKKEDSFLLAKVDGKSLQCRSLQKNIAMLSLRLSTREEIHVGAMEVKLHAFFSSASDEFSGQFFAPATFLFLLLDDCNVFTMKK